MALHEHPLAHRLCSAVLTETHTTITEALGALKLGRDPRPLLLDVGCWEGDATLRYAERLGAGAAGIEIFDEPGLVARSRGIDVAAVDLEVGTFPWDAGSFDVVVANQVFEHLKNIWSPLSEIYRVLKPGGHFVVSVPNLASAHNRVLLALGRQPTSIRTFGAHVRGYTLSELVHLVTYGGAFECRSVLGVGFYPLPARLARPLARTWSAGSHTVVVVVRKAKSLPIPPWDRYRQQEVAAGEQTFYR